MEVDFRAINIMKTKMEPATAGFVFIILLCLGPVDVSKITYNLDQPSFLKFKACASLSKQRKGWSPLYNHRNESMRKAFIHVWKLIAVFAFFSFIFFTQGTSSVQTFLQLTLLKST